MKTVICAVYEEFRAHFVYFWEVRAVMDALQLNELLECSVCLEQLDQSCKVLPCQHTVHKRCLKEIVETRKELRCPECRILVKEDIDDLPANILLVRLLEGLNQKRRNSYDALDSNEKPSDQVRFLNNGIKGIIMFSL